MRWGTLGSLLVGSLLVAGCGGGGDAPEDIADPVSERCATTAEAWGPGWYVDVCDAVNDSADAVNDMVPAWRAMATAPVRDWERLADRCQNLVDVLEELVELEASPPPAAEGMTNVLRDYHRQSTTFAEGCVEGALAQDPAALNELIPLFGAMNASVLEFGEQLTFATVEAPTTGTTAE